MLSGMPNEKFTMDQLEEIRKEANKKYPDLNLGHVDMYSHDGGVEVEGMTEKQWVFFPGRDGATSYDWSLWKILNRIKR